MEIRDINYILPHYITSYLFAAKNEWPEKIVFPMFESVMHGGKKIPIEWVPPLDPRAIEIAQDGTNVPEVTPEQEAALDAKDEEIERLRKQIAGLQLTEQREERSDEIPEQLPTESEPEDSPERKIAENYEEQPPEPAASRAKAAFSEPVVKSPGAVVALPVDRKPKMPPGGDIGTGLPLSDMHGRDRRDNARTKRDLADEPGINENEEIPYQKDVKKDSEGNIVVED